MEDNYLGELASKNTKTGKLILKKHFMSCWPCVCIYSTPPDDELEIWPKHVEVDWRNKLRINSASSWFSLYGLKETGCENMNWIHLVKNEEQWRAFVDTVMNFGFHKTQIIYWAVKRQTVRVCSVTYMRNTIWGAAVQNAQTRTW